jgi:hypothetical protein
MATTSPRRIHRGNQFPRSPFALGNGCQNVEIAGPLHDSDALVTACARICMHRKRVNISTVLAGQRLGIKEVADGIWIVSFMHYDLGFIVLEEYATRLVSAEAVHLREMELMLMKRAPE